MIRVIRCMYTSVHRDVNTRSKKWLKARIRNDGIYRYILCIFLFKIRPRNSHISSLTSPSGVREYIVLQISRRRATPRRGAGWGGGDAACALPLSLLSSLLYLLFSFRTYLASRNASATAPHPATVSNGLHNRRNRISK